MKRRFIIIFLSLFLVKSLNVTPVNANKCSTYKFVNDISTINYKKHLYQDILKICTDEFCTYLLDNDVDSLFKRHHINYINKVSNIEKKEWLNIHGVKVTSIHFLHCI